MAEILVRELAVMTEATWSHRDSQPRWQHRPPYGSSAMFDPFPAYPHQILDVEKTARHVEACCPPIWDVELFVADREEEGRSNGYSNAHEGSHYKGSEWVRDEPTGLIVLSGKRVPPHPAMTRHLVAHEYGHNVEYMLNRVRGAKSIHSDDLVNEYAKVRALPESTLHHGSGGRWHDSATEIFACDFRIIVCDIEPGFWPHPGITHPQQVAASTLSALESWWADALTMLVARRVDVRPDE